MSDAVSRLNSALEGRYAVERELGQGGMATVYLAQDVRHNRNVALKVLKPELAAVVGADRFLAEIETTAGLQHPHILPLFDSGEADGFLFYVMPYVEGETLADRIAREKQLPVDEAIGIATAVANALHTAHEAGVVHRDIKPGNILLSRGEPLVADFGIALAVGAAGGSRLTETGLSVGTPYYMSPEQATGDQAIGPASDTYALACVLYEMLVGEPPYLGNTAQAVLGKIIQGLPVSASAARRSIPPHVDAAIRKALEKLPADRFTGATEFARALGDRSFRHGDEAVAPTEKALRWKRIAVTTSTLAVVAAAVAVWSLLSPEAPPTVMRQEIAPVAGGMARAVGTYTALAPDGSSMVYALEDDGGSRDLWLKYRDASDPTLLSGTQGAQNIAYSPDGQWIVFAAGSELRKRPIRDGPAVTLAEGLTPAANSMVALAWLDDGTIVYELPGNTFMRVPEAGGQSDTIVSYSAQGFTQLSYAGPLPGSKGVLVSLCPTACQSSRVVGVMDFAADTTRILLDEAVRAWYTPTGHLMYVRPDGAVFAAPFDLERLELTGAGIPLFEGIVVDLTSPQLAVGPDGTLLIGEGITTDGNRSFVWVDREGTFEPVDGAMASTRYRSFALSPNDDRVAFTADDAQSGSRELWVKELPNGPVRRLTTDMVWARRPVWSPDGDRIAYINQSDGPLEARILPADGSTVGTYDLLLRRDRGVQEVLFTPDPTRLVFREGTGADGDIGLVALDTEEVSEAVLGSSFFEGAVSLSPDARWLAYVSNAAGQDQVFVRPFPELTSRVQVSTGSGFSPVWAHDRNELFYVTADENDQAYMAVATYATEPTFRVTGRERLFSMGDDYYFESAGWRYFDVAQGDERFLLIRWGTGATAQIRYILVQNYFEELERIMDGAR